MPGFGKRVPGLAIRSTASALALSLSICAAAQGVFAQVVIDGSSATNVVVNPNGSVTVGIAPAVKGVSHNRYTTFNVPKPGVALDNRAEAARTIVNEVTGTARSAIEGTVEVLGQRAHVIIANPNGIVIDGGRFVNTGRVALTTGKISGNAQQIAPGIFQDNVVSTVTGGTITVSGGGLSGQMDAIDLIAHTIKVHGPIRNDSTNDGASLRLAAGSSRTEFDSAVLPGNTGLIWGSITGAGATSDGAVLVEITRPGVLRANRVGIEVSDKGAGVRFAGEGYATSRSFSLSADGQIDLTGAKIETATGLSATGRAVKLDGSALAAAQGAIVMEATAATGAGLSGVDFALTGQDVVLTSASDLRFGVSQGGATRVGSSTGDIVLQAQGTLIDAGSVFAAQRNLVVSGDQTLRFSGSSLTSAEGSIQLETKGAFMATGLVANAFAHFLLTADDVSLDTGGVRSALTAANGSFIVTTLGLQSDGGLTNRGGLIQGGTRAEGLQDSAGTQSEGAVTLNVKGGVTNSTTDTLAVIFGAGGDVVLRSGGDIENNRGRVLANGDVKLFAQGDVLNMVDAPNGAVDPVSVQYTLKGNRQWWTLWIKRKREAYVSYDYGTLENTDQLAAITGTVGVTLQAGGSLINQGGEINANDGDLEIKALRVETIGLGSGKVYVRKVCVLTCSYEGDGAVTYYGGRLNAAGDVTIEAGETFLNKAGSVFAIGDVDLTAGEVVLEAALVPTLVTRPAGLYNFWASKAAWIFLRDQFGSIVADTGNITVNSARPVKITGGTYAAGGSVVLESGEEIVRAPSVQSEALNHSIGLFAPLPLIRQD